MKQALHLLDRIRFGGGESVALNYARLMSGWGIVSVLCGKKDSKEFAAFAGEYAAVRHRFSLNVIRNSEYIFIHTNRNLLKLFFLRPFFRRKRKQIVYIQHLPYSERKFRLLSRLINRVCTGFIRITPETEELSGKYIRVPVRFIPNFYLLRYDAGQHPAIRSGLRRAYGIPEGKTVILFSGVLRPGKGLDDFLRLAKRFGPDNRFLFVVAGAGEESGKVKNYSGENVLGVGWQADVERWLIACDVYCFFSRNEMLPMALTEAMTLGKPVAVLSSPVNDFLLPGKTFSSLADVENAFLKKEVPVVLPVYGRAYAEKELEGLLGFGRPKKLLHIQVMPKMTGVQRVSLEIFRGLPEGQYEKMILFGGPDTPHTESCFRSFRESGARVVQFPDLRREIGWKDGRVFREIYRLCKQERFDIVHTHSTKPGIVGRIAARLAGVPLVVHTVHGVAFHRYEPLLKRMFYYLAEFFASFFSYRITLVSAYYKRYYRIFGRKVTVIHNGLDYARFSPFPANEQGGNPAHCKKILFAGRLEEAKDPLTLLKAMNLIVNRYHRTDICLTLLGDGTLEEKCREYIALNDLSGYVSMKGWQENPAEYYAGHQIFCLSSIHESFGLCLLEAGFYGLPAVAARVGGVPEVVADGKTGYLVPPRDPETLAGRILELADDPALCVRMGQNARSRVTECFSAWEMVEEYQRIYKK